MSNSYLDSDALDKIAQLVLHTDDEGSSFVLCGSSALKIHKISMRLSADLDFFLPIEDESSFQSLLGKSLETLESRGYSAAIIRKSGNYSKVEIGVGDNSIESDFGCDYFSEPPIIHALGMVRSRDDAVGAKLSALYSRGAPKDYVDTFHIIKSCLYSRKALISLCENHEAGFIAHLFGERLKLVDGIVYNQVKDYLSSDELLAMKETLRPWGEVIVDESFRSSPIDQALTSLRSGFSTYYYGVVGGEPR